MSNTAIPTDLSISGMSCGHCVAAVRETLEGIDGVEVRNVAVGRASLTREPSVTADVLVEAIRDAGYDAEVADARAD